MGGLISYVGCVSSSRPSRQRRTPCRERALMWEKAKVGVQRVARASRGDVEKIIRKLRLVVLTTEGIEYGFLT